MRAVLCILGLVGSHALLPQLHPRPESARQSLERLGGRWPLCAPPESAGRVAQPQMLLPNPLGRASRGGLAFLASRPRGLVTGIFVALLALAAFALREKGDGSDAAPPLADADTAVVPEPVGAVASASIEIETPLKSSKWTEQVCQDCPTYRHPLMGWV
eukprot:scaffold18508_cov34-Tisochrysis_lutea.AAC.1